MHDNLQIQSGHTHHTRIPVSPETQPLTRNHKVCVGPQPLSDPTEPVPSLPHHSCSNRALPPRALRVLKQPHCVSSQHTAPAMATTDHTSGDMFSAVCTETVPVEGRDVGAEGPPHPHSPRHQTQHHFNDNRSHCTCQLLSLPGEQHVPVTTLYTVFAVGLSSECP